jgi:hypothetical protein
MAWTEGALAARNRDIDDIDPVRVTYDGEAEP